MTKLLSCNANSKSLIHFKLEASALNYISYHENKETIL